MTASDEFVETIDGLRGAVAGASSGGDPELRRALEAAGFATAEVADLPGGGLSHVRIEAPGSVAISLAELEAHFGPAHRLPPRPDGWALPALIQFDATIPGDGETGATVIAEVDHRDRLVRVTLRQDRF